MSEENQPIIPTERSGQSNLVERFYKQPQIEENQIKSETKSNSKATKSPLYECNLCDHKYNQYQSLVEHNVNTHSYFNFVCWVCQRNLNMSHSNMVLHFRSHEDHILQQKNYIKKVENILFSVYTKKFTDVWPLSIFENEHLNDISEIVRINAFMKKKMNVYISCKLWFIPKPTTEEKMAKYVWSTLPSIRIEWSSLNIKRKISDYGKLFMTSFLELDSIEDSGSGFVYYATSDISIKCVKMVNIGCFIPLEEKYTTILNKLTRQKKIFNPQCDSYCLWQCLEKFSLVSKKEINTNIEIFQRQTVSFFDFEEWDQKNLDFGLRILIFEEENLTSVYPIFVSDSFFTQSTQINLLAISNRNTEQSAHFILILNLQGMLSTIRTHKQISRKDGGLRKVFFCNFCLQKQSNRYHVITQHEKFCLNNPNSSCYEKDLTNIIEFETNKTFLKCSDDGKSPPNWIGFVDFETISVDTKHIKQDVCETHKKQGKEYCMCALTSYSDVMKALSYSLILIDFNTKELLSEVFYIQKNSSEMTASSHFISTLMQFALAFQIINQINYPIIMTKEQRYFHEKVTNCQKCGKKFSTKKVKKDIFNNIYQHNLEDIKSINHNQVVKTAHHIHHLQNDNFSATICSKCNLSIQCRYDKIPIFCHNFGRFDHALILKDFCKEWSSDVEFIPKSFNNIMCIKANPFVLKDSLNFLSGSLDENVEIVKKSCLKTCENCQIKDQCKRCKLQSEKKLRNVFSSIYASKVSKVEGEMNRERFLDNLKKAAFPYSVLTSYQELKNMTIFPKQEMFDSVLRQEKVDETEFLLSQKYFYNYCENMYDFLKAYNLLDTHLLYAVWRVMSETLSKQFGFYIENFVSLPGYSIAVAKSFTPHPTLSGYTCIEMFSEKNKDIYFKSLENIRGGIVQVNSRFELDDRLKSFISIEQGEDKRGVKDENIDKKRAKCEDKREVKDENKDKKRAKCTDKREVKKEYEDKKEGEVESGCEELLYLDATNLYGYCLSNLLPCGEYTSLKEEYLESLNKLMNISDSKKKYRILNEIMPDDSSQGFAFEIKIIDIPKRLHEFPPFFARQNVKSTDISEYDHDNFRKNHGEEYSGNKCKKLLPLVKKGATTFCHYKLIKQAVSEGVLIEILSGISFTQKYLFRDYIAILAKLRANTLNPAHSRSFKLLSNALFGKLLQSILKYNRSFKFFYVEDWENYDFTKINNLIQERQYNKTKKIFKDIRILDKDFFAIETQQSKLPALNCPLIAFSILELAKTRNFSCFWKIKSVSPATKLLYCDTDSFILKIKQAWYEEVRPIKYEFDFSKSSLKFHHLMKISAVDKESNKGIIGKYKSEIEHDVLLMGFIALQKKCYCLLMMKQLKCKLCQKYTALCQCVTMNYQGKQLYYIIDNASAKGKQVKQLSFANYLETLLFNRWNCESRYKIAQENKKLYFAYLRYKSLTSFDDSNFTKNCGIHSRPFLDTNHTSSKCNETSCKDSFTYLNYIEKNLEQMKKKSFSFENGEMKIWSSSSFIPSSSSLLSSSSFSPLFSTT